MGELPVVPQVMSIRSHWHVGGDTNAVTSTHFKYLGGSPSGGILTFVAEAVAAAGGEWLKPLMSAQNTSSAVELTDLNTKTGAKVSVAGFGAGNRAGTALPANCSLLLNLNVARRYRGGKPRNYLPFGVESDLENETSWTGTFQALAQTNINAWIGKLASIAHEGFSFGNMVGLSYYNGSTWHQGANGDWKEIPTKRSEPYSDVIVSASCNKIIGSQRRRLRPG